MSSSRYDGVAQSFPEYMLLLLLLRSKNGWMEKVCAPIKLTYDKAAPYVVMVVV